MIRKHLSTILVAMVTAAVTAGAPAIAAAFDALNADKVDGKHAVGAGASVTKRKGKLVATNKQGRLPNNIIKKAPDANKLDGKDSTAFLGANEKAANADKLDGVDSADFMRATGASYNSNSGTLTNDAPETTLLTLPGLTLKGTCAGGVPDTRLDLAGGWSEGWVESNGGGPVVDSTVDPGQSMSGTSADPMHHTYQLSFRSASLGGSERTVTIEVWGQNDSFCRFAAWGIDRSFGGLSLF